MRARWLTALLTAALCCQALAGCGAPGRRQVVTVLVPWLDGTREAAIFEHITDGFTRRYGTRVRIVGTRDADTVLESELRDSDPPDLAVLSSPGRFRQLAATGAMRPLDPALDRAQMTEQYNQQWRDLMHATGPSGGAAYYGVVVKAAAKSLLWYDPRRLPDQARAMLTDSDARLTTLVELSGDLAAGGIPPWCLGMEDSSNSGWPGTDWIEDILLHQAGPQVYDRWIAGTLSWTSSQVTRAWQTWGELVLGTGVVHGDILTVLTTNFGRAGAPMFADPPGCYLEHAGSFIAGFYTRDPLAGSGPDAHPRPGRDFDVVPFPAGPAGAGQEVAGDLLCMFEDSPAARNLIRYLSTPAAQRQWVVLPGAVSANLKVPMGAYPDGLSRRLATALVDAPAVRFDASDSMPQAMSAAFEHAVLAYLDDPARLRSILVQLDRIRVTQQ